MPEKSWGAGPRREAQLGAYFPQLGRSPEAGGPGPPDCVQTRTDRLTQGSTQGPGRLIQRHTDSGVEIGILTQ